MKTYKVIPLTDRMRYMTGAIYRFDGLFAEDHGYTDRRSMRKAVGICNMRRMEAAYRRCMYNHHYREFRTLKAAKKYAAATGQKVAYKKYNSVHYINPNAKN